MKHLKIFVSNTCSYSDELIKEALKLMSAVTVINLDHHPSIGYLHDIAAAPAVKLFEDEKCVKYYVGRMDRQMIQEFLK